jgi:O-antigen/teichoic acid export membrane protein
VASRIKSLFRNLVIYGLGDVATSLVSFLLLPLYTRYLAPADYGIIAMLLTIEAVAKILFRWGVDTAFMRLYFDCGDTAGRQRLASTIFFFLLAVNGSLVVASVAASGWLSLALLGTPNHGLLVALVIANTFVASFYFIPLQVLRIGERSGQFIALVFARSAATLVARLVLVIGMHKGVLGIVLADVAVTTVYSLVLIRWFVPLVRPVFSRPILREALAFGLPRIPHSIASQVIGLADRYFLRAYRTLDEVGIYSIGASFGLALKLFLSAFEYAWTPFFLGLMNEPDAKTIYSRVSTYVLAVLVLLVAGLCAVSPDLIRLATTARFHSAAPVTPWIAVGVMFQGVYLVGSIGLIITKRTRQYPVATGIAAATSVIANALLIPTYGVLGAAWANAIAYATLAGVTVGMSWRVYPILYEWRRLAIIFGSGALAFVAATAAVPLSVRPLPGLLLRGSITVAAYATLLWAAGFFHANELEALRDIRKRALRGKQPRPRARGAADVEMAGEIVGGAGLGEAAAGEGAVPEREDGSAGVPKPGTTHRP